MGLSDIPPGLVQSVLAHFSWFSPGGTLPPPQPHPRMARYDVPHQTYDSDLCYDEEEPLSPTLIPAGIKKAMATNPVPENRHRARSLAEDIADGLKTHEQGVGVKQNTQAVFRAALTQEQTAFDAHGVTKSGLSTAYSGLQIADSNAKAYLGDVRLVLVKRYGQRWTTAWAQTRFPNQSTAVPRTQDERFGLCLSLKKYFEDNPTHENADMGATATLAAAHHGAIQAAREAINTASTANATAQRAYETAWANLLGKIRGFIGEVGGLLADDDPRWHAFGLSMPSDPDSPEPVGVVAVEPGLPGSLYLHWLHPRRATRCRVFLQIEGVDPAPRCVATRHEDDATLSGLTSGAKVKLTVIAANDAGEAQPSAAVEATVP